MLLRNTLSLMLSLGLFMATFSALASEEKERSGVIRAIDQTSQQVTIDEQSYRISRHTQVNNLTNTASGLQPGYPVRFSAEHGELKHITIYPRNAAQRRELGYQGQNDFPQ